ncbi:MAG: indole-3-glycerol phosphate synthase TrpC [Pseudomonadota bacterium]|nr:indole-3-glycerol phosphate synthase TrpC [Pseudomonadota bacterium]
MLAKICAETLTKVERAKAETPFADMDRKARNIPPCRGFAERLHNRVVAGEVALIAEIKKASPSAGVLRTDFNSPELARVYEAAGATCLSVLTDGPFFDGRNEDLIEARAASTLPVLRKDFMLDIWQVAEARIIGADCILLIMAALDDKAALELHRTATGYGMDVLVEVHDKDELLRALLLPSGLIGINNRNLKTLKTDLATTEHLAPHVPKGRVLVSESGISGPADIARMRQCGAHCFLVGESLLKETDVAAATKKLISP